MRSRKCDLYNVGYVSWAQNGRFLLGLVRVCARVGYAQASVTQVSEMGKQQQTKKKKQRASPLSRSKATKTELLSPEKRSHSISEIATAWRYVVVYLLEIASWTLGEVTRREWNEVKRREERDG